MGGWGCVLLGVSECVYVCLCAQKGGGGGNYTQAGGICFSSEHKHHWRTLIFKLKLFQRGQMLVWGRHLPAILPAQAFLLDVLLHEIRFLK